jgi:hypothetical protein
MLKILDKTRKYVIVKMDKNTFNEINNKNPSIKELIKEARNSDKTFTTHEELMKELMS